MKYRPEIDGLRALALLPVIFFHAGFGAFSGGFVGVDIFFVISGYLITRIILSEHQEGNFSIRTFYARRARRILPALLLVMLVCIPVAWSTMLPSQLKDFSISLLAVSAFVSNIFFWLKSGYFAAEAIEKPLLHTWSLGIEEQFYIFMPLVLGWILRKGWPARPLFLVATLASFLVCIYASVYAHSAGFFLLPTRAWELLVGSLCAFAHTRSAPKAHDGYALIGLCAIAISPFVLHEHMHLPSVYSLLPVLGTALVLLFANEKTVAARLLSWRPLVGIGLVSYSAYLWHHPLFAFTRLHILTVPSAGLMLALSAAALGLGALTWRYVEQPFRLQRVAAGRTTILLLLAQAIIVLCAVHGYRSEGRFEHWKAHVGHSQLRAYEMLEEARAAPRYYDDGACRFNVTTFDASTETRLRACSAKYGKGIAVIGDSHAINLFHVLRTKAQSWPFVVGISQAMCRPHAPTADCYYNNLLRFVKGSPEVFGDIIYKQAGFHLLMDAQKNPIERGHIADLPLDAFVPDYQPNLAAIDAVSNYLAQLATVTRVTWFGSRIEPQIRGTAMIRLGCDYPFALRPNQEAVFKRLDQTLKEHLKHRKFRYVSRLDMEPFDAAHELMTCERAYFMDGDHYSPDGEKYFGERITLDKVLGKRNDHER